MSDVIDFKTRAARAGDPKQSTPNEQVVAMLEDWLAMARKGELVSLAMAGILDDGCSLTAATKADYLQPLVGAIAILQHRVIDERFQ